MRAVSLPGDKSPPAFPSALREHRFHDALLNGIVISGNWLPRRRKSRVCVSARCANTFCTRLLLLSESNPLRWASIRFWIRQGPCSFASPGFPAVLRLQNYNNVSRALPALSALSVVDLRKLTGDARRGCPVGHAFAFGTTFPFLFGSCPVDCFLLCERPFPIPFPVGGREVNRFSKSGHSVLWFRRVVLSRVVVREKCAVLF